MGDPVIIKLGYDGDLREEFRGYVKRLNYKVPIEIECEDAAYPLRQTNLVYSAKEVSLKQCLNILLKGVQIGYCVDLKLKNVVVNNKTAYWLMGWLKSTYGLTVFFDVEGRLYVCRPFDVISDAVKYRFRYNVIKDGDMKYISGDDIRLNVKAICFNRDGEKIEGKIGDDGGEQKTLYFYDVSSVAELKMLAETELKRYKYDGYRGKIKTFLQPFAMPCMVAELEDPVYPERSGRYFIESVDVRFGTSGARRIVEIGMKV